MRGDSVGKSCYRVSEKLRYAARLRQYLFEELRDIQQFCDSSCCIYIS
ncbi:hypothetical protein [Cupriavidus sp. BIS7]|nr:hypothetical protein [Cupriavidus sp. BIS7]